MKRVLVLFMALVMLVLVSCGTKKGIEKQTTEIGENTESTGSTEWVSGENCFYLVVAKANTEEKIPEPYGFYNYYGVGEEVVSFLVPYSGETIYDSLVSWDNSSDEITVEYTVWDPYYYLKTVKDSTNDYIQTTNILLLSNGEYFQDSLDTAYVAGADKDLSTVVDNLKQLVVVLDGWEMGTM